MQCLKKICLKKELLFVWPALFSRNCDALNHGQQALSFSWFVLVTGSFCNTDCLNQDYAQLCCVSVLWRGWDVCMCVQEHFFILGTDWDHQRKVLLSNTLWISVSTSNTFTYENCIRTNKWKIISLMRSLLWPCLLLPSVWHDFCS